MSESKQLFLLFGFGFMFGMFFGLGIMYTRHSPDPTYGTGTLIIETGQAMKVNGEDVPIYRFYHEQEVRSED